MKFFLLILTTSISALHVVRQGFDSENEALESAYLLSTSDLPAKTFTIPPVLYQSTEFKVDCIPDHSAGFERGLERKVTNDEGIIEFLKTYYHPNVSATFQKLKGAHRADLYRYALLYVHGGIYADIKVMPTTEMLDVFKSNTTKFTWYSTTSFRSKIFNGLMASPPRNPHFLQMVHYIVQHSPPDDYFEYCYHDGELLESEYKLATKNPIGYYLWFLGKTILTKTTDNFIEYYTPGLYETEDRRVVLLQERCSYEEGHECTAHNMQADRYGICCNVYNVAGGNNILVAHSRDITYPDGGKWKACT
jgi:hypothetical protein